VRISCPEQREVVCAKEDDLMGEKEACASSEKEKLERLLN